MKQVIIIIILCYFRISLIAQEQVSIDGKVQYLKNKEIITNNFSIFTICQDNKLKRNCQIYYLTSSNNYRYLPISKSQILNSLKNISTPNKIKGIKSEAFLNIRLYYFQSGKSRVYISKLSETDVSLYPINNTEDIFIQFNKSFPTGTNETVNKCRKIECPKPPTWACCPKSGELTDCCLRYYEDAAKCSLKCAGLTKSHSNSFSIESVSIKISNN